MSNPDLPDATTTDIPLLETVSSDVNEITETHRMLAEVAAAAVEVGYFPVVGDNQCDFLISLPHNCSLDGYITFPDKGRPTAYLGNWNVNEKLRGNGIGRRLMEKFNQQAGMIGIAEISTSAVSPEGLRGVSSYFGFENLEILGIDAEKFKGMSLQRLLALMESGSERGYALKIKIR